MMIEQSFQQLHGRPPQWIARAPGRVNLIGEHTDYNGGFVLPMAIERHTEIAAAFNDSTVITLRSSALDEVARIDLRLPIEPDPVGRWTNYPKGVLAGFLEAGYPLRGFDALVHSTVPVGGGLSSSAAFEIALATLLEGISGRRLDPMRKAELCQQAEHRYARVPCGLMDQIICALGRENHLLLLDCGFRQLEWIDLGDPAVSVLIVQSNVRHELASGEYAVRRRQCEAAAKIMRVSSLRDATPDSLERYRDALDDTVFRRARHVLSENARTWSASRAIREGRWLEAGELMYASHDSLRTDFEVSCNELDAIVDIARSIGPAGGVFGCRMTGGGFGGCAVALIQTQLQDVIMSTIATRYAALTGIVPSLFVTRPTAGATLL